jgi:hydroxyacylglutathione hydrolase
VPYIKQFQHEMRSCLSYYVCCPGKGVVAIIDPSDEIEKYTMQASNDFAEITSIIDTHIHGDHISGARRLSQKTGAPIFMHESAKVDFDFEPLAEGEVIDIGNVSLKALFTPGHTTESMSLLYVDHKRTESPWSIFTGDTLFIGDIGRLDFTGAGTTEQMYDSLFEKILGLPDYVELFPAHYVGSVCGRGMSLKTTSTIGFERKFNPMLQAGSFKEFEKFLLSNPLEPFPEHLTYKKANTGAAERIAPVYASIQKETKKSSS